MRCEISDVIMYKDRYGRRICDETCIAYFERDNQPYCDANLMYFSKDNIICKLSQKYGLFGAVK